ncbi:MAG: TatD family hydrolase [Rikenellaceae bacterium]|jgi:TatD DNase family protein|nr:TatD family hydrolase [Rikenellaceae bacterium]
MIDTHSHMFDSAFDTDRAEALQRAVSAGVERIVCPALDSQSHEAMLAMCRSYPTLCLPAMGVHPTSINDNADWRGELEIVEKYLAEPPVERFYAIGEVGLDLHWGRDWLAEQTIAFERQIELALQYGLPLLVHTRDAWSEMHAVLENYAGAGLSGIMHAFSGTFEDYLRVREVGDFVLGVGGSATYKKNLWPELLPQIDPSHIVLETDAPWLPPVPFRGQRNESSYLTYTRDAVAAILDLSPAQVDGLTTATAHRIFKC